jgi:hypothetical protein
LSSRNSNKVNFLFQFFKMDPKTKIETRLLSFDWDLRFRRAQLTDFTIPSNLPRTVYPELRSLRKSGIMMMLSPMQGFGGHHQHHQRQMMQMQNVPHFTPSFALLFPPARDR